VDIALAKTFFRRCVSFQSVGSTKCWDSCRPCRVSASKRPESAAEDCSVIRMTLRPENLRTANPSARTIRQTAREQINAARPEKAKESVAPREKSPPIFIAKATAVRKRKTVTHFIAISQTCDLKFSSWDRL